VNTKEMAADLEESRQAQAPRRNVKDRLFELLTLACAAVVLAVLGAILLSLVMGSWQALSTHGIGFLFHSEWDPINGIFGALAPIYGTLVTSFIAIAIGVPLSFGIAMFITELSPRMLRRPLVVAIELLAGIPSIIYGMWGLFVFAPLFGRTVQPFLQDTLGGLPGLGLLFAGPPMGVGMLTAGLILALMITPFISSVMREVFDVVPKALKESAYAMGATTWEVMARIVVPQTKLGLVGGVMLGLGRALGETMAVTLVIGNAYQISPSLFAAGNTISSVLANEFAEADDALYTSSLMALGLVLFLIAITVLVAARLLLWRLRRHGAN
jgi:phosphate transport system permease protein